ncbi:MAG TPA: hypothetical protein VNE62_04760 [Actinomycetota bacterium]|nr:hypothetical protein [Actinomycetota bacterium]
MSRVRRVLCSAIALAVAASVAPVTASAAQADDLCHGNVIVFSHVAFPLPANRADIERTPSASYDMKGLGCISESPRLGLNTAIIYPGAQFVSSRLRDESAATYCFEGSLLDACGAARNRRWTITFPPAQVQAAESDVHAIDPSSVGCLTASFDDRGHTEYCTATELRVME